MPFYQQLKPLIYACVLYCLPDNQRNIRDIKVQAFMSV